jgi:hypothetical protein
MRLLIVLLILVAAQVCAAESYPAELGDFRRDAMLYRGSPDWRNVSLEASAAGLGGTSITGQAGVGASLRLTEATSGCVRLSVARSFHTPRRDRYRSRGLLFETGVRTFTDLGPDISIFSEHTVAVGLAQFSYGRFRGRPSGTASMLRVGTAHTLGLEYGNFTWRGFFDFGVRTSFPVFVWGDRPADKRRQQLLWNDTVQWLAIRAGVRLYL